MLNIQNIQLYGNLKYSKDHEWVDDTKGEVVKIGITDYAQKALGDIVFVELPEIGKHFSAGEVFGVLESIKAISECYMPVSGSIKAINEKLFDSPELINKDPYGEGWILEVELEDNEEIATLLAVGEYYEYISTMEEGEG